MKLYSTLLTLIFALTLGSCFRPSTATYHDISPEFIRSEPGGKEVYRVWGKGNSKQDAIANATHQIVRQVLFDGVPAVNNGMPVVTTVNAEKQFADYFNKFFGEGGKYMEFVETADKKPVQKQDKLRIKKNNRNSNVGVILVVNRQSLREEMLKAGIIK